jgi:hypothetical protein
LDAQQSVEPYGFVACVHKNYSLQKELLIWQLRRKEENVPLHLLCPQPPKFHFVIQKTEGIATLCFL